MGSEAGIPFGNYTLLKRIARGGMAEVFVARQKGMEGFDRLVAIKRILPHLLDDKSFVRMFQDEARLAARLSHPNVIHIYDFGKVDEHFFIAMEYMHSVHAGDLIRLAADTKLPMALVARIGANACAGLHYAHNRKDAQGNELQLVHRDVSPPNLLVSYDGVVKLVDFGIAKAVSSIEQTRPGVVKGKYAFMSPEQTMGQKLNGRSDVFSLGLVLWELLAGTNAVTRDDQILAMQTIRDGKVPPIQSVREDVPKALADALAGALKKSPTKRSDARQFGKELETFIKSSKEIATSMELGAWLSEHLPPKPVMSADESGEGTKPATAATGLQPLLDEPTGMVFAHPAESRPRGSVVSRLEGDASVADHSGAVQGDLTQEDADPAPELEAKKDSDSVVVARDLIDGAFANQKTRDIRAPGPQAEAATTIDERGFQTRAAHLDDFDEPTNDLAAEDLAARTVQDQGPPAALGEQGPSGPTSLFVDAEEPSIEPTFEPTIGPTIEAPQATPTLPALAGPASSQPRLLQLAPWFAGAFVVTALLVIASMGNGETKKKPAPTEPDVQPIVFDPNEAEAHRRDGSSGVPPIVVTPLPDAGSESVDFPPEPEVTPEEPTRERHKRRRESSRKNLGSLEVRTQPNSDVLHRKSKLGRTPLKSLPLKAGRYELTFVSKGLAPVKRKIVIRAGETTKLNFAIED